MTYNVHLLLHIPYYVRRFGALWAWSTFPYENYNGILRNMFKSSQSVPQQISRSYLRFKSIKQAAQTVFGKNNCSVQGRKLIATFLGQCYKTKACEKFGPFLRVFGSANTIKLTMIEKMLIEHRHASARKLKIQQNHISALYFRINYTMGQRRIG